MPGPYVPNLSRVVVQFSDSDHGPFSNTFHVDRGALGVDQVLSAFRGAYELWWDTPPPGAVNDVRAITSNKVGIQGYTSQDLEVADGATFSLPPLILLKGASSSRLPPDLAMVVSWRTGINGRRGRGRSYLGGLAQELNNPTSGLIDGTRANDIRLGALKLITDLSAAGLLLVVYSRIGNGGMTTINTASVDTNFDVQRRRGN
jgi:hypothetical protein